jgi:hypothetical protein
VSPIHIGSPLLRVPADTDRRLVLALDGIRYAVGSAEISLARLEHSLTEILSAKDDWPKRRNLMYYATTDAWAIVDAIYRLRSFVVVVPRVKQRVPEITRFNAATRSARDMRHYVQHMSEKLPDLERASLPLWGSVSWRGADDPAAGKQAAYAFVAGTLYPEAHATVAPFGPSNSDRIGVIELSAGGFTTELRGLVAAASALVKHYERVFDQQFNSNSICASDSMVVMTPTMTGFIDTGQVLRLQFTASAPLKAEAS